MDHKEHYKVSLSIALAGAGKKKPIKSHASNAAAASTATAADTATAPASSSTAMAAAAESHDSLFKFIIIGDTGTGKSCLLRYFLEKKFKKGSSHTIGVEFGSKIVPVGGKKVKLQIWDTAGQERFRSVTRSYYRGAAGCLLVYDIASRETYNHLISWLTDARTLARPDITVVVVGNKCDNKTNREVTLLEASRFAQENDLLFMETSAVTGECVEEVFLKCATKIMGKIESGEIDPTELTPAASTDKDVDIKDQKTDTAAAAASGCSC